MKKRFMTVLLAVVMVASLCACGGRSGKKNTAVQESESILNTETEPENSTDHSDSPSAEKEEKEDLAAISEVAYQDFLAKKNAVSYTGRDMLYVTDGVQYRIYDLINSCTNCSRKEYETIVENTEIFEQRVDIGKDGVPELALRISNDTPNMGQVDYVFVIKYVDGELKIVSTSQGAYRSFAGVNEDGVVFYGGSGGASNYFESYDYVSPDGKSAAFFALDVEMCAPKAIVPWYMLDDCPEDYPKDFGDESDDIVISVYTPGREEGTPVYVVFEDQDGKFVPAMTGYEELWKKNGILVVTRKEAEEKIQELLGTVDGKYESTKAKELSWETLDMVEYENIYGEDWISSYRNFIGDSCNYRELLTDTVEIAGGCVPVALSGFTLADVDGNQIPELIILMKDSYGLTSQVMHFYTFDETSGTVEWCRRVVSTGSEPGQYSNKYYSMPEDSFSYNMANDRYCLAGMADGKIIVFRNYGDGYANFEMAALDLKKSEEEESYSVLYNDWMALEGPKNFESNGDEEYARKILEELDYFYFVELNADNVAKYVSEDYQTGNLHGRSGEDVAKVLQAFSEDAGDRMGAVTWYNGVIEGADNIGYSFEQMTQGWDEDNNY